MSNEERIKRLRIYYYGIMCVMVVITVVNLTILLPITIQLEEDSKKLRVLANDMYQQGINSLMDSDIYCPIIVEHMAESKKDIDDFFVSEFEKELERSNYELLSKKYKKYCSDFNPDSVGDYDA